MSKTILVTGGAGYIGSHTVLSLLEAGFGVLVIDNLCNSSEESLRRVSHITGKNPLFIKGDVRDRGFLDQVLNKHQVSAVMHFAGLKSVSESTQDPLTYFENNVLGTVTLCQALEAANVRKLVFSSSATVYSQNSAMPLREDSPVGNPTNAYGRSKLMIEEILSDVARADERWSIAILRYFNPVGAHHSGLIGEHPRGVPNNLLPYISQVAAGGLKELIIYGDDYPTPDGTGIRDYIHVMDLASGHLNALSAVEGKSGIKVWNLGAGKGYSVLDAVKAFEKASSKKIPFTIAGRRPGDIAECWSDSSKALNELGWRASRGIDLMMSDSWRWQQLNPKGYDE